ATLAWSTSDAAALSIDNGVGEVTGSSSVTVSPTQTTTYTLTATGISGDVAMASVTIKVRKPRFMVIHGSYTWHQAKTDAEGRGGRLAVLDTQEKLDQAKAIAVSNDSLLWIGLTDKAIEGQWRWIDGSPLTVSSWHPGEPNNSGNEDYAHFWASSPYWNDIPGNRSFRYLLEYPDPKIQLSPLLHGAIVGAGEFSPGSVVALTAIPDPGHLFAGWSGDASGESNPLSLEIESDLTIGALFVPDLSDADADGLSAFEELTIHGTDPTRADSDGDGFDDKMEIDAGADPNNPAMYPESTPPTITLIGDNPVTLYRGQSFTDPGAIVTDNVDAERTIVGSGSVDTSVVGIYTLTYTASDAMGNAAEPVTRIVHVVVDLTADPDADGLTNEEEDQYGTDPEDPDSDDDLFGDAYEIRFGSNPLDAASTPRSFFSLESVINPTVYGDVVPAKELQLEGNLLSVWDSSGNGRIHLFDFSGAQPMLKSTIEAPHRSHDWPAFGYSISMNGNKLLTGDQLTWLSGIHDGRAYVYDVANVSNPVLQHTLVRDAQTATYIGLRVLALNGFYIADSRGSQRYGTTNKVHLFRDNGSHYQTIIDGFNKQIEFARDSSRNAFAVMRTRDGLSQVRLYDVVSGEVYEREQHRLDIKDVTNSYDINYADNQFAQHRFVLEGNVLYFVDNNRLRIFRFEQNGWKETAFDLSAYVGGRSFSSTNLLLTNRHLFICTPLSSATDGRQGCVLVFDRTHDDRLIRFREVVDVSDSVTGGRFGSYLVFNESTQRLLVSTEFGASHAWGVVNSNQG
ncbi:MAG: DUF5011 domain-containing protein, partial [Planctomycetes bacterium]|nr:DUF5011 domain-containing protein [Planctomycetota bacterium]